VADLWNNLQQRDSELETQRPKRDSKLEIQRAKIPEMEGSSLVGTY
jgi:hypothetical protein